MNKKDKQNLIILLLIGGVVIYFIIKNKKNQPNTRSSSYGSQSSSPVKPGQGSSQSSSPVKPGQGKGGHIAIEKTPQFAEWGKGKPGERRFGKDGYIYVWNDKFGWVKTDKYNEADLNKPPTTYWIHNNPDGTYVINNNPPDGQDGKGEGNFIDTYTNYLAAAADVITEILPFIVG